jgi:Dolichyl-phosphate-mannose-protein mannosyltransferase
LTDAVVPGSLIALRVPAVLATACAVVVAGLIASELRCDRRAKGFTAAAQATGVWATLFGHWLTPNALEPVQWLLVIWLLVRWVRLRDDRLLIALGVVIGVAALTKFQILLLCVVLAMAVAAVGPHVLLKRPLLWAEAGIAAVLAAPTLVWQQLHGWPQLRMAPVSRAKPKPSTAGVPASRSS